MAEPRRTQAKVLDGILEATEGVTTTLGNQTKVVEPAANQIQQALAQFKKAKLPSFCGINYDRIKAERCVMQLEKIYPSHELYICVDDQKPPLICCIYARRGKQNIGGREPTFYGSYWCTNSFLVRIYFLFLVVLSYCIR